MGERRLKGWASPGSLVPCLVDKQICYFEHVILPSPRTAEMYLFTVQFDPWVRAASLKRLAPQQRCGPDIGARGRTKCSKKGRALAEDVKINKRHQVSVLVRPRAKLHTRRFQLAVKLVVLP